MNGLIIDCSSGMSIFVIKDSEIFSIVDKNQKRHTDELLVSLDELLVKAKLSASELDVIGVCVGPGSFTGIRVAVSIVKGLAIESDIKIIEINNFDVYNFERQEPYVLCLEGFSNNVYAQIKTGETLNNLCVTFDELIKIIKDNKINNVYVQNEKTQNLLKNAEIHPQIADYDAISCFKSKFQNGEFILINQISPVYLRASQAEIERQKKLEGKQ